MSEVQVVVNIPSYDELLASLPEAYHTEKVKQQLRRAWELEGSRLNEEAERLRRDRKTGKAIMRTFSASGAQLLAEFEVNDTTQPQQNQYNWHGQNTSQWIYAGCILFNVTAFKLDQERIITLHH